MTVQAQSAKLKLAIGDIMITAGHLTAILGVQGAWIVFLAWIFFRFT